MATTYHFRPSGYNPTLNQQPPPKASARPLITCAVILLAVLFCGGFSLALFLNSQQAAKVTGTQTAIAQTPTATMTIDSWAMTGTAIFWLTYTPTPTATPSPTVEMTATPTSTGTVTPDIPATKTALVNIFVVGTQTALASQPAEPSSLAARRTPLFPTPRPASGNTDTSGSLPPSASQYIGHAQATQQVLQFQQPIRTAPPEPPIVVTRVNVVIITATMNPTFPPTVTPSATMTLTPTATATHTLTSTPTATFTSTPSATPTETPTSTPSATFTPIPTATWTETPTPTVTPTETPTDVLAEEIVP